MKILILGKRGWLGSLFYNYLKKIGVPVDFDNNEINMIDRLDPDITAVVNFAASANIDWCEKNKNKTLFNNILGARNIALVCKAQNVKYVFISSACIFRSQNENDVRYEDSTPSPACFYTETKLMAEKLIREINSNTLIVRLRLPLSEVSHPRNVLNKFLTYKKLVNSQESATVVEDFIPKLYELIKNDETGSFNLVNEGTISPAEIGKLIGHKFEVFTKQELDNEISSEKRANRVTTIIGARRGYLPPIRDRINDVISKWKSTCN